MIIASSGDAACQSSPVEERFTPPVAVASALDLHRVVALYSFVRARAFERLHEAEKSGDVAGRVQHRQSIFAIDAMFTAAQHEDPVVASCAITFFRARAMRDANHPEFLGEWLGTPAPDPALRR